jgi:Zn-finger nucleic acid-binding protein
MYPVTVDDLEIDRCPSCEGLWFDLRENEHLKAIKKSAQHVDCAPAEVGKKFDPIRNYICPACSGPMIKIAIPEQPHIHVEQCAICCGTFFDAGEFTDFQNFTLNERVKFFFSTFKKK